MIVNDRYLPATETACGNKVADVGSYRIRLNSKGRFRLWGPRSGHMLEAFDTLDEALEYALALSRPGTVPELYEGAWL